MAVLLEQGPIQAQLRPQGLPGRSRCPGAQQGIDRIPRCQAQEQKNQAGDQPQHQGRQGHSRRQIAQQGAVTAHRLLQVARGMCSSCSSNRPEPSYWGRLSGGRAQALGATNQRGM